MGTGKRRNETKKKKTKKKIKLHFNYVVPKKAICDFWWAPHTTKQINKFPPTESGRRKKQKT